MKKDVPVPTQAPPPRRSLRNVAPHPLRRSARGRVPQDLMNLQAELEFDFFMLQSPLSEVYRHAGLPTPFAFAASNADPDTLSYEEAMASSEHRDKWIAAADSQGDIFFGCFKVLGRGSCH